MTDRHEVVDHYGAHYREFAADVYGEVRRAAFGIDVGQNSWLTAGELERFGAALGLRASVRLLDVACGSGGPALHLAQSTACEVVGVELDEAGVAMAERVAAESGLAERASFVRADASARLPFDDCSFDAILCVDAINHLPDRLRVLSEWFRLLRPGGRVVFTDPVVVTGAIGSDEFAVRASIGYFLFVPPDEDERLLRQVGLEPLAVDDTTGDLAYVAQRRHDARADRADALRALEGSEAFDGRQRFFALVALLARERRLSRLAFTAAKPLT